MNTKIAIVILAAGLGTRMKSNKAKVLHAVCGRPMISYVVETAQKVAGSNVILVVGHQADEVRQTVSQHGTFYFALQTEQLGTGHAVLCALPHIPDSCREVVILCGDVPLIQARTVEALIGSHLAENRDVSVLAVDLADPTGYGRILLNLDGRVQAIVEEADASAEQKRIKLINTGIFCVKKEFLAEALPQIKSNNAQGEIYLTDIIGIAYRNRKLIGAVTGDNPIEVTGINTIDELKSVEQAMKNRP
ncbi:MAG: NTP transferase domain-containing protein [Desulfobacterales bacterium]|jgi:UDP-N-acetylglucosamine diphosphorylase/glucosamine-1-phosphate N-acetyltransferase